jgi:ubiquinone/menaquinone biosynthesis C-methylase UbiE
MRKKTAQKILKKVKVDYEKISDDFNVSRQYKWKEFDQYLKYINDGDRVVDIGCGNGRFFSYVKNLRNVKYVGIDNNKNLIRIAQKKYPEGKFVIGDMLNLPFEDKSQDVVVSIAALHHIPSNKLRNKAVSEMFRILNKNGILIISVWNLYQPKYMKYIWKARIRSVLTLGEYSPQDTFIPWGKSGLKRYYYAFKQEELNKYSRIFNRIKSKKENNMYIDYGPIGTIIVIIILVSMPLAIMLIAFQAIPI